ncbi:MAG: GNAT family N-acetyltransferase [Thaumarchaeota archaeon]|nr:GNAT family N-acetyltransferase [Nitrososphaerota archaeon]
MEHDELPSGLEADIQLLRLSVGWAPRDFYLTEQARSAGFPSADYFGLYAVEGDRILSMVRVLRLPYTFPDGHAETISGVLSVITRQDSRGRGLARRLLDEVNARERRAGSRFSLLWSESITAHRLYESMGYEDVYTPDIAAKRPPHRGTADVPYELAAVKDEDVPAIERLHDAATLERIGFTPRPRGLLGSLMTFGLFKPDSFRLILRNGRPLGYLELQEAPGSVNVSEVVMTGDPSDTAGLLSVLERASAGRWLSFWNTFVRDSKKALEGRGYSFSNLGDSLLMSVPLDKVKSETRRQTSVLGTADQRFVCQSLDHF